MTNAITMDRLVAVSNQFYCVVDNVSDTASIANHICAFLNSNSGGNLYFPLETNFPSVNDSTSEFNKYKNCMKQFVL